MAPEQFGACTLTLMREQSTNAALGFFYRARLREEAFKVIPLNFMRADKEKHLIIAHRLVCL